VLVARQRDAGYRRTLLLATAVFIPLCVGLVLTVGVVGAAVASLAVQVLCALGFLRQSRALVDVDHSKVLLPPFATGLVMMSIVAGFHLTLVWGSALLLAAYSVTMVIRFQASTRTAELL
jgi:O-antigen/teichoic acid export membrane protein